MYTYPVPAFDQAEEALGMLGSLWPHYYSGSKPVLAMMQANLELLKQQKQNIAEAAACASRHDVPLYHTENWQLIELPFQHGLHIHFPKPPGLVAMPLLMNRMTNPTLVWQEGIDYRITDDSIEVAVDPFSVENVPCAENKCYLWGFRAQFDCDYVYRTFGYVIGLASAGMPPQRYKDTVNAIADCAVAGATMANVGAVIAAALGVPRATGEETVLGDARDRRSRFIITDRRILRIPETARISAAVGLKPAAGTPLIDLFRLYPLEQAPNDIDTVTIPPGMTADNKSITISRKALRMASCIVVQLPFELVNDNLMYLIGRVLPPQTGFVLAPLQGENDECNLAGDAPVVCNS